MSDPVASAEAFLQVVRGHGFARAAKALGKSPSALSRVVADLERGLGAQLFVRTTRALRLTEAGAAYVKHAEALVAAHRAGRDAMTELVGGAPRGSLRVSMPVSVGERLLGRHLPAFLARFPDLQLQIDLSDRRVALLEGGFDLALRVGRSPDSSLRAQLLGRIPVLLAASPAYIARHGSPRSPATLVTHACVLAGGTAGSAEWTFHRGAERTAVTVSGVVHTTSPTLAAQLAVAGVGVLRTSDWSIRDELARGELVEVMPEWRCGRSARGGVPIYVLYAQGATANPPLKARVFVDLIKSIVASEGLGVGRSGSGSRLPPAS